MGQAEVFPDRLGLDFIQGEDGGHVEGLALCPLPHPALRPSWDL